MTRNSSHRTASRLVILSLAIVFAAPMLTGCHRKYFAVTAPDSGHVYYTRKVKKKPGGSIRFVDKETGSHVRLTEYEIEEIDKDDYYAGIRHADQ